MRSGAVFYNMLQVYQCNGFPDLDKQPLPEDGIYYEDCSFYEKSGDYCKYEGMDKASKDRCTNKEAILLAQMMEQ